MEYPIRPLQLKLLDMLLAFDNICKKHNLRYYIIAGTMLGAVRHSGFIPWDDDLDVAMPRPDYDRLVANCREWLPAPYELMASENDEGFLHAFAKMQDASTTIIEKDYLRYLGGCYMDIFPLDGMPNSKLLQKLHFMRYNYRKKLVYFTARDPYKHGHGPSSWIPLLCHKLFNVKKLQEKLRRMQTKYDYDSAQLIVDHDDGARGVMPKSVMGNPTPVMFEGKTVCGIQHAEDYLTRKYGNYMQIPPADKQIRHNFHYLDLQTPYRQHPKTNANNS